MVGWKFTGFLLCFTLYLRAIFKYNPLGSLYLEGRFNGWFFAFTSLGGLQMEGLIFGILRYLAQILGQYFTDPGLCRPFFVRWTGVDFGTWDVTWDVTNEPQRTSAGRLKWWIIDRFHENLTPSTCSVKFYCSGSFFVHYSVMQNNVSKEDFIWQAQLVKCSFSLSVFSPHLGPEKTMRTTSQTTKICGFLAMGH